MFLVVKIFSRPQIHRPIWSRFFYDYEKKMKRNFRQDEQDEKILCPFPEERGKYSSRAAMRGTVVVGAASAAMGYVGFHCVPYERHLRPGGRPRPASLKGSYAAARPRTAGSPLRSDKSNREGNFSRKQCWISWRIIRGVPARERREIQSNLISNVIPA